jgi:probable rRNA maturation factor
VNLDLSVQLVSDQPGIPTLANFELWASTALDNSRDQAELTIHIVDAAESTQLNQTYRHKSGPTNVLSFPFQTDIPQIKFPLLGDIVICAPVVAQESIDQNKIPEAHWAHMVVHGILHLLGYDHQEEGQALDMERMETRILHRLGYPDPYGDEHYL